MVDYGAFLAAQSAAFDFTAGYISVVNFGFAALLGLGSYTSALLANEAPYLVLQLGLSPWITIWFGALVAGVLGFVLGILTSAIARYFRRDYGVVRGYRFDGLSDQSD